MDYIHGLLIMEGEDSDNESEYNDVYRETLVSEAVDSDQSPGAAGITPGTEPLPGPSTSTPWCKCGVCIPMAQQIENKCCGQRRCVTTFARFSKFCIDPDVLKLCIRNRAAIRNNPDDNSTRAFRKAAYRQFILDRYGHLGKGNRKVCPSCVVKTIRRNYPSQTGVYMGYRAE